MDMDARYSRNSGSLTEDELRTLQQKKIFIAGCGGLGGHLLEFMLRIGVGGITVCDDDRFEATNLNRQRFCTVDALGCFKAEIAAREAQRINPQIPLRIVTERLTGENAAVLLSGHDLVLDGLDNVEERRSLAAACAQLGIPMIHGAIQGWCAQVAVIPPGSGILDTLYPEGAALSEEKSTLSFTPALCAALQAAEAVKLLCGRTACTERVSLHADLLEQDFMRFLL